MGENRKIKSKKDSWVKNLIYECLKPNRPKKKKKSASEEMAHCPFFLPEHGITWHGLPLWTSVLTVPTTTSYVPTYGKGQNDADTHLLILTED